MILNRYLLKQENDEEKAERFSRYKDYTFRVADEFDINNPPMMKRVEIETFNVCNGKCSFCPANIYTDKRSHIKMSEEIFKKIILDLKGLGYSGRLSLHSNNEPFLDDRIIEFAKFARENLPNTIIDMCTNGTVMGIDKFTAIIEYLDEMIIDNYNDSLEINPEVREIEKCISEDEILNKKVTISLRKQNEVLRSRGGQAPNRNDKKTWDCSCILPFIQMVIRSSGKVSLCCNDVYGTVTLGDMNTQSVWEVWTSNEANHYRQLIKKGRSNYSLCEYCDESHDIKRV